MQFFLQTNKFTDEDIRGVVKSFKMNFPQGNKWNWEIFKKYNSLQNPWLAFPLSIIPTKNIDIFSKGNINKKATVELIRRIFPRFWIAFQKFFVLILFFQIWCRLCDEEHLWNLWQPKHRTGDLHLLTFHDCPSYVFLGDQQRDTLGVFDGNEWIRWEQKRILNINRC